MTCDEFKDNLEKGLFRVSRGVRVATFIHFKNCKDCALWFNKKENKKQDNPVLDKILVDLIADKDLEDPEVQEMLHNN